VFEYVIGRGGFGKVKKTELTTFKVWKVKMKKTNKYYAMKEMGKAKIITKRSTNSVMNERKLL
jgi:serum/glucocorticoid-regulated kinase 2